MAPQSALRAASKCSKGDNPQLSQGLHSGAFSAIISAPTSFAREQDSGFLRAPRFYKFPYA